MTLQNPRLMTGSDVVATTHAPIPAGCDAAARAKASTARHGPTTRARVSILAAHAPVAELVDAQG